MTRFIRVAALQLAARDRIDFDDARAAAMRAIERACATSDLVVLPEGTFPAYVLGDSSVDAASIGAVVEAIAAIARESRTVIVAGSAAADGSELRNSAFVIDADGSLAGRADKLFLWHFDRRWFSQGDRLAPIRTSIGTLGVLICADGRIPTIAGTLVDRGAEALVMPTAWVTSGRDSRALENIQADLLAQVRAYENRVPFIAANKCGAELAMVAYCGKSQIVNWQGEVVARADQHNPQILEASIELGHERPARAAPAPIAQRNAQHMASLRLAISFESLPDDIDRRLELLDDQYALADGDHRRLELLDRAVPVATVGDELVLDPAGLPAYRRAGYPLLCWSSELGTPWTKRLARARALELRLYLVVFDRSAKRAFAVDPNGTIVAGTFGDFRLASFTFDPRTTRETEVAPGTDISRGFEYVDQLT